MQDRLSGQLSFKIDITVEIIRKYIINFKGIDKYMQLSIVIGG